MLSIGIWGGYVTRDASTVWVKCICQSGTRNRTRNRTTTWGFSVSPDVTGWKDVNLNLESHTGSRFYLVSMYCHQSHHQPQFIELHSIEILSFLFRSRTAIKSCQLSKWLYICTIKTILYGDVNGVGFCEHGGWSSSGVGRLSLLCGSHFSNP